MTVTTCATGLYVVRRQRSADRGLGRYWYCRGNCTGTVLVPCWYWHCCATGIYLPREEAMQRRQGLGPILVLLCWFSG